MIISLVIVNVILHTPQLYIFLKHDLLLDVRVKTGEDLRTISGYIRDILIMTWQAS